MSRASHVPDSLPPADLDAYLNRGWYRIGPRLFTSRYQWSGGVLRSTVWTRSRLDGHRFGPNARHLLRRNDALLRTELRPASPDAEREAIYQRYVPWAGPGRSKSLTEFLLGDAGALNVFDTWELSFFLGDRLVAFSWFDRGLDSLQSLIGVFEPEFEHLSLGRYSLLSEVRLASQQGRSFHYSGYVLPGDPAMDYKLSGGNIEFLDDRDLSWHPWAQFVAAEAPLERLRHRIAQAVRLLTTHGIVSRTVDNLAFDIPHFHPPLAHCVTEPIIATVKTRSGGIDLVILAPEGQGYSVIVGHRGAVILDLDGSEESRTLPIWGAGDVLGQGLQLTALPGLIVKTRTSVP